MTVRPSGQLGRIWIAWETTGLRECMYGVILIVLTDEERCVLTEDETAPPLRSRILYVGKELSTNIPLPFLITNAT